MCTEDLDGGDQIRKSWVYIVGKIMILRSTFFLRSGLGAQPVTSDLVEAVDSAMTDSLRGFRQQCQHTSELSLPKTTSRSVELSGPFS